MPSALDEAPSHAPGPEPGRSRLAVVQAFTQLLEGEGIGWVVLGGGLAPVAEEERALAIVVEPLRIGELPRLIWQFCKTESVRCIRVVRRERSALDVALAWRDPGTGVLEVLQLELCGSCGRRARRLVPAEELIRGRVRCARAPNLFVLSGPLAFITRLLDGVDAQDLSPSAQDELCARWREAPRACLAQLLRFWDETSAATPLRCGRHSRHCGPRCAGECADLRAMCGERPGGSRRERAIRWATGWHSSAPTDRERARSRSVWAKSWRRSSARCTRTTCDRTG
jgi:hypothetical protein